MLGVRGRIGSASLESVPAASPTRPPLRPPANNALPVVKSRIKHRQTIRNYFAPSTHVTSTSFSKVGPQPVSEAKGDATSTRRIASVASPAKTGPGSGVEQQ